MFLLPDNAFVLHRCCFFFLYFRKAREDEKSASVRLNEMIANYGDVIPRRDFEALEKKYKVADFRWMSGLFVCFFNVKTDTFIICPNRLLLMFETGVDF